MTSADSGPVMPLSVTHSGARGTTSDHGGAQASELQVITCYSCP